ncbi:protein of unknown function [Pilibacter termitis]|uniref:Uncharacterized protein n=1 Tax=Pilibacter termitis TaxID=263852 RepID=A0A1T4M4G9_9ENTE|nr:DUF916 and DUF3324 domain-containing protein [Pilibacter termitis]SJZ61822.1 protein of unknown function [Pilibacter termitis]
MKLLKIGVIFTLLFGSALTAQGTRADEKQMGGYSVTKGKAGEEINPKTGYYDLKMTPGETREITVILKNNTDKEIGVNQSIFTSHTNTNGEADYTSLAKEYDKSLKVKLHEIITLKEEGKVKLDKQSEKELTATIKLPKDVPTGILLGSWYFLKDDQVAKSTKKGMGVKTQIAFSLPIKITVGNEIPEPNLNLVDIQAGMDYFKKSYLGRVQNDQPALMTKLTFLAKVTKKGSDEVLFKNEMSGRSMAPNSNYQFPVHLNEKQAQAGEYTYSLEVISEDPKWESKNWRWEKDFTITKEEAEKINKESLNDPKPEETIPVWLIVLLTVFGLGFVSLLVYIIVSKKRKRRE